LFKPEIALLDRCQRRDSGEDVIKYYMELRRDVLGAWVENQRNQTRMSWREANKNSLSCPTVPFGNLLAVLKARVEDIHWATKDMGTWQSRTRTLNTREQLFRRQTNTGPRQFVVYPHRIVHSKGPKVNEGTVWPMKSGMEHVGSSHIGDCLNHTLSHTVLMMSPHSTES
jgi:hypothetical protein